MPSSVQGTLCLHVRVMKSEKLKDRLSGHGDLTDPGFERSSDGF